MPKMNEMLLKFQGFQYATSLDLNMGYYNIRISYSANKLCTITIPWGKYYFRCLPMVIYNSLDIFHQKMNDLFHRFGLIRSYIDNLVVLTKVYWENNVHKSELNINKLNLKGLKFKIEKYFFGHTKM